MSDFNPNWDLSDAYSLENLKPCNGHLLVKLTALPEMKTESGLVIGVGRAPDILSNIGTIVSKGECSDEKEEKCMAQYEIGDTVRIVPACGVRDVDLKSQSNYVVVYCSQIMGKYKKESEG